MFHLHDDPAEPTASWSMPSTTSAAIAASAASWRGNTTSGGIDPNIEVVDVDLAGDRRLMLRHSVVKGAQLDDADAKRVLQHLADLWTYDVSLTEVDFDRQGAEGIRHEPTQHRRGGVRHGFTRGE